MQKIDRLAEAAGMTRSAYMVQAAVGSARQEGREKREKRSPRRKADTDTDSKLIGSWSSVNLGNIRGNTVTALKDKIALITGAGGEKGVGRGIALKFASLGANLVVSDVG